MKENKWKKIASVILLITLVLSIAYSIYKIVVSNSGSITMEEREHLKSDYTLMLLQCCLGLVVMFLPTVFERRLSIHIPDYMCIMYFVFLYCAIYLGEVRSFYYLVPHWDTILHSFSGGMLGALGFTVITMLNNSKKTTLDLSPFFIAMFAFSFALAIGTLWEIYEFTGDALFNLNMQKYRLEDGTALIGQIALRDTMKDLIVDALSALIVTIIGFSTIRRRNRLKNKGQERAAMPSNK